MTDDPRPETKHEKFERLRDARIPKITHAMGILGNLGGAGYEASDAERRAVVAELQAAVDNVAAEFGVAQAALVSAPAAEAPEPKERPASKPKSRPDVQTHDTEDASPTDPAEGGALAKHEIAWAYDAVQRKDWKLAANRLKRVIDMWR